MQWRSIKGLWEVKGRPRNGLAVLPRHRAEVAGPLLALVDTAAQRLGTAELLAARKFKTGKPVDDPVREREVVEAVVADAIARGVDPDYVAEVFRDQIDATSALEHGRFAQWKFGTTGLPTCVPSLADCRTVIDILNRAMVDNIATCLTLLQSSISCADLATAVNVVTDARQLDPLAVRALAHATQRFCSRSPDDDVPST